MRFWMIRRCFFEFSKHVSPTCGENDTWTVACSRFVRLERVADDDPIVAADERLERGRSLVVAYAMADNARRSDAPDLPRPRRTAVEALPARLIEANHRLSDGVIEEDRFG